MAPEKQLIDARALMEYARNQKSRTIDCNDIARFPTVDAVVLPCKIGDTVWAIRCYRGALVPQQGKVSEMLFADDMKLCIVVKHICRGEWGEKVFATEADAELAIAERSKHYA